MNLRYPVQLIVFTLLLISTSSFTNRLRAEDAAATTQAIDWKSLDTIIGVKGELKDEVYIFTLPRNDLSVSLDSMDIPVAAGIESKFYFYQCSCGKTKVVGQFCCSDYEANDVVDAIRPGALLEISSMGPMFAADKPRLMLVRFQGEGDASGMARLLKSGLRWMGEARSTTQPLATQPSR